MAAIGQRGSHMLELVRANPDPILAFIRNWHARYAAPCPEAVIAQVFSLTRYSVRTFVAEYENAGIVRRVRGGSGNFEVALVGARGAAVAR